LLRIFQERLEITYRPEWIGMWRQRGIQEGRAMRRYFTVYFSYYTEPKGAIAMCVRVCVVGLGVGREGQKSRFSHYV